MRIRFERKFEPRDVWVGLFWDAKPIRERKIADASAISTLWVTETVGHEWHVYICLLPTLLLHWWWVR
jgi:hypothetical protein